MRVLATVKLHRDGLTAIERPVLSAGGLSACLFRYDSGVDALAIRHPRGEIIVLPWLGQMIWSARFDGVSLAMRSAFPAPLPADTIASTYGCLLFHSGLLRNGVPAAGDDHPAHGEFPTAALQRAWLELLDQDGRLAIRLAGERDHVVGFGANYRATPSITLADGQTMFAVAMQVLNRSGKPMELMYMAHANFAFVPDARMVQAAPFTPAHVAVRRATPAHVRPTPAYDALIEALATGPERTETLSELALYDPEQVFYLRDLGMEADGTTAAMLVRPQGDAFAMRWRPDQFPHCVRWIMHDPDQSVAGFALPSTCEPEGHAAETRKGHVRLLAPGETAEFTLEMGYLDRERAAASEARIATLAQGTGS